MSKKGPILIIEDDQDDHEIIKEVLEDLEIPNPISFFSRCNDAFTYLKTSMLQPFLILCDVNLPEVNGLDFKKSIDQDLQLRQKAIPFIFFSTARDKRTVTEAYTETTVQGFFQKKGIYEELRSTLKVIMDYWKICLHPHTD